MTERETKGPSKDQIAERAYEIYQQRGSAHGGDIADWIEAEKQLYSRSFSSAKTEQPQQASSPAESNRSESRENESTSSSGTPELDTARH
jgi:hypothetical protein